MKFNEVGREVLVSLPEVVEFSGSGGDFVGISESIFQDLMEPGLAGEFDTVVLDVRSDLGKGGSGKAADCVTQA